jgi:hypothetical protein
MNGAPWRVPAKCNQCPFHRSGPGLRIRRGLRPGRWREILAGLRDGGVFSCHKTVEWDDEGEQISTGLYCAGALEWQAAHGCTSNYARVAERLSSASATERIRCATPSPNPAGRATP